MMQFAAQTISEKGKRTRQGAVDGLLRRESCLSGWRVDDRLQGRGPVIWTARMARLLADASRRI
jgi:hypothetical protein